MYLNYQQVASTDAVQTVAALTVPARATHAELQADTNNVRYTMDNATDPDQLVGMVLLVTSEPKLFLIDDIRRIRFHRGAAANGNLNIHYFAGRDV